MLILSKADIKKVFTMKDAIAASKTALRLYSENKCVVPLRIVIDTENKQGLSLFMPAYVHDMHAMGIKLVSVYPGNVAKNKPVIMGKMLLLDTETGEVCAMLDG